MRLTFSMRHKIFGLVQSVVVSATDGYVKSLDEGIVMREHEWDSLMDYIDKLLADQAEDTFNNG